MRLVVCAAIRTVRVVGVGADMVGASRREMYRAACRHFGEDRPEFGDAGEDVFVIGGWGGEDGGRVKVWLDFGASPGRTLTRCRTGTKLVIRNLTDGAGAIIWTTKMRWMGLDSNVTYRCGRNRRWLRPGEQPTLPTLAASRWGTRRIPKSCQDLRRREMGYCSAVCARREQTAAELTFLRRGGRGCVVLGHAYTFNVDLFLLSQLSTMLALGHWAAFLFDFEQRTVGVFAGG